MTSRASSPRTPNHRIGRCQPDQPGVARQPPAINIRPVESELPFKILILKLPFRIS
jgi:hypothetical protein